MAALAAPTWELGTVRIPAIGYGVGTAWFKAAGTGKEGSLQSSVAAALDAGFRHIDEAEMYGNEAATGEAIKQWMARTGTPRDALFVTSKVMSVDEGVEAVCRRSLSAMGLTYFDLYLVHAAFEQSGDPFRTPLADVWRQMEELVDKGLVRQVGVSNWRVKDLRQIVGAARIPPAVNQVEAHPYLQQPALARFCAENGIRLSAYSPLAPLTKQAVQGGPVDTAVAAAAARAGKSASQVLLRWSLQTGRLPITTTSKAERFAELLDVFGFELSDEEVASISAAGASCPRRFFWTATKGQFHGEDPSKEEDTVGA